jgi:hypothetical protein
VNPFQSLSDYEEYVYTLPQQQPHIISSTLVVARRGRGIATVMGEIHLDNGYRLSVYEILTWDHGPVVIQRYSYEIWYGNQKHGWYDPQPHPDIPELDSTAPHHKHIPPDVKHHRLPAPGISFEQPNLLSLIAEILHQSCDQGRR